jgi:hypothetical protein
LYLELAASEENQELLAAIWKLLPSKDWWRPKMLNIALATENDYILSQLNYSQSEIDQFRQREEEWVRKIKKRKTGLVRKATVEGNYFQVAAMVPELLPGELLNPLLDACKGGMVGIAKVLIEQGKANPEGRDNNGNSPIGYAKGGTYKKLQRYLLRNRAEG